MLKALLGTRPFKVFQGENTSRKELDFLKLGEHNQLAKFYCSGPANFFRTEFSWQLEMK